MTDAAGGLHHVTAIAGAAGQNLRFYTQVLGLRLVKRTVNFDDPATYHLYYGDELGRPGSILTFFPWPHAAPGRIGIQQAQQTAFRVPAASIGYWTHRFIEHAVPYDMLEKHFGETTLAFTDYDGTRLALVACPPAENEPAWSEGAVPVEHAVRGLHGVTLMLDEAAPTAAILTDVLGFNEEGREGTLIRFSAGPPARHHGNGLVIDIRQAGEFLKGRQGRGSVHHVAFRAADEAAQARMAQRLVERHGVVTTEVKDRQYFRSVYFREPGGILFEIATDAPGFARDEPVARLGSGLMLPSWLEPRRGEIETMLPDLDGR